jgi:hypothetical protein
LSHDWLFCLLFLSVVCFSTQLLFFLLLHLLLTDYLFIVLFVIQIKLLFISSTCYHHPDITWDHLG